MTTTLSSQFTSHFGGPKFSAISDCTISPVFDLKDIIKLVGWIKAALWLIWWLQQLLREKFRPKPEAEEIFTSSTPQNLTQNPDDQRAQQDHVKKANVGSPHAPEVNAWSSDQGLY